MVAFHVLEQGQRLAECAKRIFYAGLAVRFGGGVLRLEEGADRLGHVLREPKNLFGNVGVLLQCFECFA
ncbi:MAG: hypothetical protein WBB42_08155 [Polyangiales bacterium]